MLPDALPRLMDSLLRLPHLDAAQLRELIQHLPDPQASTQEMLRRGWITQEQFSSLFPGQKQHTARETILLGFGDDEFPPDAAGGNWDLPLNIEEDKPDAPPKVERALAPPVAGGNEALRRENDPDKLPRQWLGWAGKSLLICTLLLGLAGLLHFLTNSSVLLVVGQAPKTAIAGEPARVVDFPDVSKIVQGQFAKVQEVLLNQTEQNVQPAAPVAVPRAAPVAAKTSVTVKASVRANDARPKVAASLYARVRQTVVENRTEETERLGIGDVAYQNVADDGSIMVGMQVTYAPFFNHQVIKSIQPIYQKPDGKRYEGPICGMPTAVGERVEAKDGYAIGGAAIQSGMGIDGMQLTFMEIGADGLNPNKSYLSKWLGINGSASAKTFVNDGRPIVGIAGMWSKMSFGPAYCMSLVTTKAGALATADGVGYELPLINNARQRDGLLTGVEKNATPAGVEKNAAPAAGSGIEVQRHPQGRTHVATVANGDDVVRVEYTLDEHGKVLASRVLPR